MVRRIDLRQNSVRRVADDYLLSSTALSMFRFDMNHDLRLEMFLKLGAYLKFQQKEGILSSGPYPPLCHHIITCHLLADPTSPSSDDVIYEQPLMVIHNF